jgi:K+-sensing histidine kinase KdpD
MSAQICCPVAKLERLLLATDGSKYSDTAVLEGISIAKRCGSDLIALSVATKDKNLPAAKKSVEKARKIAEREGLKVEALTPKGMPYEIIVKTAGEEKGRPHSCWKPWKDRDREAAHGKRDRKGNRAFRVPCACS